MSHRQNLAPSPSDDPVSLLDAPEPELQALLARKGAPRSAAALPAVAVGQLVALADDGRTPLVSFAGQRGAAAVRARSVIDLRGSHIGHPVVLNFEGGDPALPIVMGVLREHAGWPLGEPPAQVEVDIQGERLVVSAKQELVLRCGKASVTLTRDGQVLIRGSYVSSRSSGVNRLKGGSVQLN